MTPGPWRLSRAALCVHVLCSLAFYTCELPLELWQSCISRAVSLARDLIPVLLKTSPKKAYVSLYWIFACTTGKKGFWSTGWIVQCQEQLIFLLCSGCWARVPCHSRNKTLSYFKGHRRSMSPEVLSQDEQCG